MDDFLPGVRKCPYTCVLAKMFPGAKVTGKRIEFGRYERIELPHFVREFVMNFDQSNYPELIKRANDPIQNELMCYTRANGDSSVGRAPVPALVQSLSE